VKGSLVLLGLGVLAALLQGVLASWIPPQLCPDLGLLMVLAAGLCLRSLVGGLVVASLLGYLTDLLSGSLLGQHALLRLLAYLAVRYGSRHLSLRTSLALAACVAALTVVKGLARSALSSDVAAGAAPDPGWYRDLVPQALVNAVVAPLAVRLADQCVSALGDEDAARRTLRFDSRSWPA
jgi:rod shape-determining protein MreD